QGEEILTVGRDFQVAFGIDTENDENPLQHVKYINYDMWDVGDFDYAKPDSASSFGTDGYGLDNGRLIWMGHAFAENTLIYGADWDAIVSYFDTTATPIGDQVTIAAFTETPIDGWGVDISHAGVLNLTTAIEKDKEFVANKFELGNNYPNPFNPTTSFTFSVPAKSNIQLNVYNAIGQKITTLVNKEMSSGKYTATWNGTNNVGAKVSSGLYFYELKADNFSSVKKMLLIK
ncbi:MAG: T9SS type A sorting domain-containing protein, partial [Spirochaetes bacterium]|nr:T9SS type A sorting domain-containing protein [Spirochaetota bacterium]